MAYIFYFKANQLLHRRPKPPQTFNGPLVLEVFSKPEDQKMEAAIKAQFVDKLPPKARKGCQVVPMPDPLVMASAESDKRTYTIVPTGAYEKEIEEQLKKEPRDFGCGPYGKDQATSYFEYHPQETRGRFVFVKYGWRSEKPLFDEQSIELIDVRYLGK